MFVRMGELQLENPKETRGSGDCRSHELELAYQPLPIFDANAPLVMEVLEDCKDAILLAVYEFKSSLGGVKDPSKNLLLLTPSSAFAFQELLL